MYSPHMKSVRTILVLAAAMALLAFFVGCSSDTEDPASPGIVTVDNAMFDKSNPQVRNAMVVQNAHTPALMATDHVVGTAIGRTDDGLVAIMVLTKTKMGGALPDMIEGYPVVEFVTGVLRPISSLQRNLPIVPFKGGKPSGGGHTTAQALPIQLGTTGGWQYDLANGYCCAGTFGSLVTDGTNQYIMSNTHVLAMDIVLGGNNRIAAIGDPCIHPGLIDVGCNAANATAVATLATLASLPQSNVDVALAKALSGYVRTDGSILEIGVISSETMDAYVGLPVKKSGRTTGLTTSTVSALNGTVNISYEDECAGEVAFTKTFTGQIIFANSRSSFLGGGDSGSLCVENVSVNPRAVGLLFAGSSVSAIANPIDEVLDTLGPNFSMVGN